MGYQPVSSDNEFKEVNVFGVLTNYVSKDIANGIMKAAETSLIRQDNQGLDAYIDSIYHLCSKVITGDVDTIGLLNEMQERLDKYAESNNTFPPERRTDIFSKAIRKLEQKLPKG